MTESRGTWLKPTAEEEQSFTLEPEFPEDEHLFVESSGGESGETEIPEALRGLDTDITAPTDQVQSMSDKEKDRIPETLQDMDMRITTPEDAKGPVQEEGDIEFPGLTNPLPGRDETVPPPERAAEPEPQDIIGVDFSLDEDIFENIEEITAPEIFEKEVTPKTTAQHAPPPADIEFADLLDLEELLLPTEEKK